MSLEAVFKGVMTVLLTAIWFWSVKWLWTTQIDPRATFAKVATKPFEAPSWVATRDPKKIYQNGVAVGDVTGDVKEVTDRIQFAQLANTGQLKRDVPIEYQRYRLRIVEVRAVIGMKSVVTDQGSQLLTSVMEGVTCQIIQPSRQ